MENLIFAIANLDDNSVIQKIVDPKNQGELQTIIGYIRPKGRTGAISPIEIRKPMQLHVDKKTDNTLSITFDCTTLVEKERAVDFSVEYVVDVTKPETAILQNCRFLGTRKLMKPASAFISAEKSDQKPK
ncbi:MAG: hypothetical protein QM703_16660 [Gemmatales bacterium]